MAAYLRRYVVHGSQVAAGKNGNQLSPSPARWRMNVWVRCFGREGLKEFFGKQEIGCLCDRWMRRSTCRRSARTWAARRRSSHAPCGKASTQRSGTITWAGAGAGRSAAGARQALQVSEGRLRPSPSPACVRSDRRSHARKRFSLFCFGSSNCHGGGPVRVALRGDRNVPSCQTLGSACLRGKQYSGRLHNGHVCVSREPGVCSQAECGTGDFQTKRPPSHRGPSSGDLPAPSESPPPYPN